MTDESHIRLAERHRIADWLEERAEVLRVTEPRRSAEMEANALCLAAAELRKMDT